VVAAIGASRVGVRFSPFSAFQGTNTSDILEHYGHVISKLDNKGLSYVHLIEPRFETLQEESARIAKLTAIARSKGCSEDKVADHTTLKYFRGLLKTTPLIVAGGYNDTNSSVPISSGQAEAVVIGRYFTSNPDIVERIRNGWPLAHYDRSTFYSPGNQGYTDHPTYQEAQLANLKV
jgi:2,4-dienoyl-CoA reductase-like NADH-dependent reductase (Old Yellow Enzyme family)